VDKGTLGVLDHNLSWGSLGCWLGNWGLVDLSGVSLVLVLALIVISGASVSTKRILLELTWLSVVVSWLSIV
jgi:hypothetical protein